MSHPRDPLGRTWGGWAKSYYHSCLSVTEGQWLLVRLCPNPHVRPKAVNVASVVCQAPAKRLPSVCQAGAKRPHFLAKLCFCTCQISCVSCNLGYVKGRPSIPYYNISIGKTEEKRCVFFKSCAACCNLPTAFGLSRILPRLRSQSPG